MQTSKDAISKVPEVTLIFWVIKIAATTLGETAGDSLSMSLDLGYLLSTLIFASIFIATVIAQTSAKKFHPFIYWVTIVATTTVGTTLADFADRSLGIGYAGGTAILFALLVCSLLVWYKTLGTIAASSITSTPAEVFYWITIMFSQTLGTALGDWTADTVGLGYTGGALIFVAMLAAIAVASKLIPISRTVWFWPAFILTRPLGAVVGDFLDKPLDEGGLALNRFIASGLLALFMIVCIIAFPQEPARKRH